MAIALQTCPTADSVVSQPVAEPPPAELPPASELHPRAVFDITVRETDAGARVVVRGELDVLTAPRLRSVLRNCAEHGSADVVIDLGRLDFLDARGLSVLVESRRRLGERHRCLTIASLSGPARRILDLTGLTQSFTLAPTTSGLSGPKG